MLMSCASPLKKKGPFWYNGYVYGTQAFSFYAEGKLDLAIESYKKALAQARRLDIPQQFATYTFNIGRCWLELNNYDSAVLYFRDAYAEFCACHDTLSALRAAGFIALSYCQKGSNDSAFSWYARGTAAGSGKQEPAFWLSLHGRLLWNRDHEKNSLNYFEEAYSLYHKEKALNAMAQLCRFMAGIYCYFSDFQEAEKCIEKALSHSDKSGLRYDRFRILLAASFIYAHLNDLPAARRFFERAHSSAPSGMRLTTFEEYIENGKYPF
jgi:tetratricopeptide (TPR) repeat protein